MAAGRYAVRAMAPARIFLSYRRDDSAGHARAISDALGRRFGADQVFIDVDDIGAGQAFDQTIHQALGQARVLLVLIGRRWLAPSEAGGAPRLHQAGDLVQQEIASALQQGLQVIPVLLDGAGMPPESALPEALQPLARRQAVAIDTARFAFDLQRLGDALVDSAGLVDLTQRGPGRGRRGLLLAAGAGGLVLAGMAGIAGWAAWRHQRPPPRPAINGRWLAEVAYDWLPQPLGERFDFSGDGLALQGSASFLRVPRLLIDGHIEADGRLSFSTRSQEHLGSQQRELTHRYEGRLQADGLELHMHMRTEGSAVPQSPREFSARRAAPGG